MHSRAPLAVAVVLAIAGCRDGATPPRGAAASDANPTDARRLPWDGKGAYTLVLTDFHFELGGTQITIVDDRGKVRELFVRHEIAKTRELCADGGPVAYGEVCKGLVARGESEVGLHRWFIAEYTLTASERARLVDAIVAARIATLDPRYAKSTIPDGTTRTYRLVTATGAVEVSAYATDEPPEPAPLRAVAEVVSAAIAARPTERAAAKEATSDEQAAFARDARSR